MIIRIRSPEGMSRIEIGAMDTLLQLAEKVAPIIKAPSIDSFILSTDALGRDILSDAQKPLAMLGFKHGDIVYAKIANSPEIEQTAEAKESSSTKQNSSGGSGGSGAAPTEKVDRELEKDDGLIKRKRDTQFCRHGENGMCEYCMPIEPYDQGYLAEKHIKHLSFYAYLRQFLSDSKIRGDISNGPKPNTPLPLENPDYRIDLNCQNGHAPWPKGMCSKCQPSAITLQPQKFRMVDHVEFAHSDLIDRLLAFWRSTQCQRFGVLYGRYERYDEVPLGIKAVVEAIYEPKQAWDHDGIRIDLYPDTSTFDQELDAANNAAKACGLEAVGMIFTDLDSSGDGKVLYRRHANSYFLTALECRLAAYMQVKYPNKSRWAQGGYFGSRFVTCCVSGNENNDIEVTAWQVSNSAAAMEQANLITPSTEPSYMCVNETTKTRYVPEIFYRYNNEYNLPVTADAKDGFPVDYLLVNLTHGFPTAPTPMFTSTSPFCIENREHVDQLQSLSLVKKLLSNTEDNHSLLANVLSDFHLLVYLSTQSILTPKDIELIAKIAVDKRPEDIETLVANNDWKTLTTMLQLSSDRDLSQSSSTAADTFGGIPSAPHMPSNTGNTSNDAGAPPSYTTSTTASSMDQSSSGEYDSGAAAGNNASTWVCRHCTFENTGSDDSCEMCALPRDQ